MLETWGKEILRLGFPASIEAPFDPYHDTGFRPATYKDQKTGFEFYLDPASEILNSYPHIKSKIGNRDKCATFRWGGDLMEMSAALASASTLTKLTGGVFYYPDDDILYQADEVVEQTKKDLGL